MPKKKKVVCCSCYMQVDDRAWCEGCCSFICEDCDRATPKVFEHETQDHRPPGPDGGSVGEDFWDSDPGEYLN